MIEAGLYPPYTTIEREPIGGGTSQWQYRFSKVPIIRTPKSSKADMTKRLEEAIQVLDYWRPLVRAVREERPDFEDSWQTSIAFDAIPKAALP